jgi:hypothetical protein
MSKGEHETLGEALDCSRQPGRAWLDRIHTPDEQRAAAEHMLRGLDRDALPTGVIEALVEWKLIATDLDAEHRHTWAGGGIEAPDHVRSLLLIERRMQRIAEAHHKGVDAHGGTWGDCNECGHAWPCPTYAWATSDDRDPSLAAWDPMDDAEGEA